MPEKHICAEIQYETPRGNVHSDLCTEGPVCSNGWRQLLHSALDEWLDKSDGTGHFTVGNLEPDDE
jgi:hypothetical protein